MGWAHLWGGQGDLGYALPLGQQGTGSAGIIVGRVGWCKWWGDIVGTGNQCHENCHGRANWDTDDTGAITGRGTQDEHCHRWGIQRMESLGAMGTAGVGCRAQVPLCFWRSSVVCSSTS